MCLCVFMYEQVPDKARDAPGAVIISGHKLLGMGSGTQTQVLTKGSTANFSSLILYYYVSPKPDLVASADIFWMDN